MTHVLNENGNQYTWRLSRSVNNGATFSTITTQIGGTRAPTLLSNSSGWVYLLFPDWNTGHGRMWIYKPADGYTNPVQITIPNAGNGAGKFASAIDESKGKIYFFTGNYDGNFFILDLNGNIISTYRIVVPANNYSIMYPYLYVTRGGELILAWTSANVSDSCNRGPIFCTHSSDGGQTWWSIGNEQLPLNMNADGSSGNNQVSLTSDNSAGDVWLSNMFVSDNYLFFHYYAANRGCGLDDGNILQRLIRYNLGSGKRDEFYGDSQNTTTDQSILMKDYVRSCTSVNEAGDIYCLTRNKKANNKLAVIVSQDYGETWKSYISSSIDQAGSFNLGSSLTADGYFYGSTSNAPSSTNNVYFVKFPPRPAITPGDINEDGHVNLFDYNELIKDFGSKYTLFDYKNLVANYGK